MQLSFGDDGLEVAADAVQVTKSDGSVTDQESVNQLLVAEIQAMQQDIIELEARVGRVENIAGIVNWPLVGDDGVIYEQADCHKMTVLVSSTDSIILPVDSSPLIMVNSRRLVVTRSAMEEDLGYPTSSIVEVEDRDGTPRRVTTVNHDFELGDEILFVGDWHNWGTAELAKVKIDRIGLNSVTGKRNQVTSGAQAFVNAVDCDDAVRTLDISNVTDMSYMFANSSINPF